MMTTFGTHSIGTIHWTLIIYIIIFFAFFSFIISLLLLIWFDLSQYLFDCLAMLHVCTRGAPALIMDIMVRRRRIGNYTTRVPWCCWCAIVGIIEKWNSIFQIIGLDARRILSASTVCFFFFISYFSCIAATFTPSSIWLWYIVWSGVRNQRRQQI